MVVILPAAAALTGVRHERTACPSRCTVQAPHSAAPQPYLVPVRPSVSRSTHSNGVSESTSTSVSLPLTLSLIMEPPFRRRLRPTRAALEQVARKARGARRVLYGLTARGAHPGP